MTDKNENVFTSSFQAPEMPSYKNDYTWHAIVSLTVLLLSIHFSFEWIFFVAKPSFLSMLPFHRSIPVYFGSILFPALLSFLILALFRATQARRAALLLPVVLFVSTILILFDNFTTTVLKFRIQESSGVRSLFYVLLVAGLLFVGLFTIRRWLVQLSTLSSRTHILWNSVLTGIGLAGAILCALQSDGYDPNPTEVTPLSTMPNILLIGADGLESSHLSMYGYDRKTSPFLEKLAAQSLLYENALSNANRTAGSLTSLLTGKLTATTGIYDSFYILKGRQAYEHLPGLLRKSGYGTVQMTVNDFGDAFEQNLRSSFDFSNGRYRGEIVAFEFLGRYFGEDLAFFSQQVFSRVTRRLLHIFHLRAMKSFRHSDSFDDANRLQTLIYFLKTSPRPLFAHVHFVGTHGPRYNPSHKTFSEGKKQNAPWMADFYDDAILDFDVLIRTLYEYLKSSGKLENTLLVFYSDHGMNNEANANLPLMIRFPSGKFSGRIQGAAQLIDIVPTLLDYLGIPRPQWMDGESLHGKSIDSCRRIYTTLLRRKDIALPPLYTFQGISVSVCNKVYKFDFLNQTFQSLALSNYRGQCGLCEPQDPKALLSEIIPQIRHTYPTVREFPIHAKE